MGTLYRVVGNFLGPGVALWAAASNSSRRQEGPEQVAGATVLWMTETRGQVKNGKSYFSSFSREKHATDSLGSGAMSWSETVFDTTF